MPLIIGLGGDMQAIVLLAVAEQPNPLYPVTVYVDPHETEMVAVFCPVLQS